MIAHRDLAPERQERLHELVRLNGVVRVDAVSRELGVSTATVRRDLEVLEQQGRVRRVHGGAMSIEGRLEEPQFDDKTEIAPEQKLRIAEQAASLIHPGNTVFLDGGSTILELARIISDTADITVVTNSLHAAVELSTAEARVILVGGELRRRSQTIVGPLTGSLLEGLHFDIAFMGTIGVAAAEGLTTTDPAEAYTKQLVMSHADKVVLLAHSGKVGAVSFARAGGLEDIDVLITDGGLQKSATADFPKNVQVIRV